MLHYLVKYKMVQKNDEASVYGQNNSTRLPMTYKKGRVSRAKPGIHLAILFFTNRLKKFGKFFHPVGNKEPG